MNALGVVDIDRLNTVTRRLGEAVVDPGRWPVLMEEICSAVGTTGAALLQSDIRTPDVPLTPSIGEFLKSYFANNLHVDDVRASRGVPLMLGGHAIVTDQNLFGSQQEMLRDPLYAHAGKWDFRWWAGIGFKAGSALWALALQRTSREGPFEALEIRALGSLPARLTETATLSKAVGRAALLTSTNALDLVRRPAIALSQLGLVIDVNRTAAALFDDELWVRNRRLIARDRAAASEIDRLGDRLRASSDTMALTVPPIIVRRRALPPVIIQVLPVDGAARSPFLGARAILVLNDLAREQRPELELLRQLFNVTAAEARLARLMASGVSPEQAAEMIGVARETVRNQLKAIFAKTGTHRQSELVALLSRLD